MRKILVIDDDREMADLLRQSLAQEGFELSPAESGEEGIERGRNTGLDLILLDVNLPGMNGFEVLRRLRRESNVPVIMANSSGNERVLSRVFRILTVTPRTQPPNEAFTVRC